MTLHDSSNGDTMSPRSGREAQQIAFSARLKRQQAELPTDTALSPEEFNLFAEENYQNRILENNIALPSVIAKYYGKSRKVCPKINFFALLDYLTPDFKWKSFYAWPYNFIFFVITFIELSLERLGLALRTRGYERLSKVATFVATIFNRAKTLLESIVHFTASIVPFLFSIAFGSDERVAYWRSKMSASVKAFFSAIFNSIPILSRTTNNVACYSENNKMTLGTSYRITKIVGRTRFAAVSEISYLLAHCNPNKMLSKSDLAETQKRGELSAPLDLFRKSITNPSLLGKVYGAATDSSSPTLEVFCNPKISLLEKLSLAMPNIGYLGRDGNLDFSMICQSLYTIAIYGPLTLAAFGIKVTASILGNSFHKSYNLMRHGKVWWKNLAGFALTILTFPLFVLSHLLHMVSNAIEYARGVIDCVVNFVTGIAQTIGLIWSDNTWQNVKEKLQSSIIGFFKNALNLLPAAIIIGLFFIPFVGPALGTAASIAVQGSAAGVFIALALTCISSAVLAITAALKQYIAAPLFAAIVAPFTRDAPVHGMRTATRFPDAPAATTFTRSPSANELLTTHSLEAKASQHDLAAARLAAARADATAHGLPITASPGANPATLFAGQTASAEPAPVDSASITMATFDKPANL